MSKYIYSLLTAVVLGGITSSAAATEQWPQFEIDPDQSCNLYTDLKESTLKLCKKGAFILTSGPSIYCDLTQPVFPSSALEAFDIKLYNCIYRGEPRQIVE